MSGFIKMKLEGQAELQREIDKLAKRAGIMGAEFADFSAGVTQRTVVRNIQPFGAGGQDYKPGLTKAGNPVKPGAKAKGEMAVWKSLHNAFKIVHNNYSGADLAASVAQARSHHQRVRNNRGRVPDLGERKMKIHYTTFQAYGRRVLRRVGEAKGSLAASSHRLGTRLPKWVKEHRGGGRALRRGGRHRVVWHFTSYEAHTSSDHVMGQRGMNRVFRVHKRVLRNTLRGKLRKMGKKF